MSTITEHTLIVMALLFIIEALGTVVCVLGFRGGMRVLHSLESDRRQANQIYGTSRR